MQCAVDAVVADIQAEAVDAMRCVSGVVGCRILIALNSMSYGG